MRLVADENIIGLDALPRALDVTAVPGRSISPDLLVDADALWVRSVTPVGDELLDGTAVRFVGTATAGTEHIDRQALARRGIAFAAAPGANAMAVVEYVLAAFTACRRPWELLEEGGTLGILGYGNVGRRLAVFARAMGWRVRAFDPWVTGPRESGIEANLDEIFACDVISLHTSLHRRAPWPSFHLVDERRLAGLDSGQWLVNASRGAVIDHRALGRHLAHAGSAQFVLDVWEPEPDLDWSLLDSPNLHLATPHIAGYSLDAKAAATQRLLEAMKSAADLTKIIGTVPWAAVLGQDGDALEIARPGFFEGDSDAEAIRRLVASIYDIEADDRRFRALQDVPGGAKRAAGFDALRRDYPLRRELSATFAGAGSGMEVSRPAVERFLGALRAARAAPIVHKDGGAG